MTVTRVRWTAYRVPFRAPYVTSLGAATHREGLIIEVTQSNGRFGLGEAVLMPEVPRAAEALAAAMERLAPCLTGDDLIPSDALTALRDVDGAVARALVFALDTAYYDLVGQHKGVSMARLFAGLSKGGVLASHVAVNALVGQQEPHLAARAAAGLRAVGYGALKLKAGLAPTPEAERRRVAWVRDAIGPYVKLRLDPNGAWGFDQAVATIRAVSFYDIEYVEQPIPPGDIDALRRLQAAAAIRIAADEDAVDEASITRIIDTRAAGVIVLKPSRLTYFQTCLRAIEQAEEADLRSVVTTSIESGVGTAACLHLAATLPRFSPACGLATTSLLESDLTTAPIHVSGGAMRVPDGSGLGVTLDEAALARYTDGWHEAGA